jgi:drug/metabolite transporter (DMT)-like permease
VPDASSGPAGARTSVPDAVTPDHTARRAAIALFAATLTIAISSVLVRRSYRLGATPEAVIVLRTGVPAVLLALFVAIDAARGRLRGRLTRGLALRMLLLGACLLGGASGEIYALSRLQAPIAILFFALAPLWITLLSRGLYGTMIGSRRTLALAVALVGVTIVVGIPSSDVDLVGALFAFGGGVSASFSFLLLEGALSRAPMRLVWAVALGEASLVSFALHPSAPGELGRGPDLLLTVFAAGLLAGVAQLLATYGVRAVGAVVAGIATALEPVNAAVIAWIVLDETVGVGIVVGGLVVLSGVYLALTAPPLVRPGRTAVPVPPVVLER